VTGLRQMIEAPQLEPEPVAEAESISVGDDVVVQDGPLAGIHGVVHEIRGGRKLIVWIATIGRGVAFTIGTAKVRRA
jgi:transcription antitermination factor NusG